MFTCLLVVALNKRSQWRRKSTADEKKNQSLSRRDAKTIKMVGLVAGVLVVCTGPGKCLSAIMFFKPDFNFSGEYANISHVSWAIAYFTENISSTINILFYYNLNSKYRCSFHEMMSGCSTTT
jgi:hypothetical protein